MRHSWILAVALVSMSCTHSHAVPDTGLPSGDELARPTAPTSELVSPPPVGPGHPEMNEQLRSAIAVAVEVFRHLDCELDDIVDDGEVVEHNSQVFRRFDVDRSISLSPVEYRAIHRIAPATSDAGFRSADRNQDGLLSVEEFRRHLFGVLAAVDANHDGQVTLAELEDLRQVSSTVRPRL